MAIPVIAMAQLANPEPTYTALSNSGYTATVDLAEPTQSNTQADALVDGDVATFWETPWSTDTDAFPHWLQIDMGSSQSIDGVYIVDRANAGNSPSICTVSTSTDGTTWIQQGGTYTPGYNQYSEKILLRFPAAVSCQYYKIEFTSNYGTGNVAAGDPEYSVVNVAETGAIVKDATPTDATAYNRVNWTVSSTSTYNNPASFDAGLFGANDLIDQSSTYWRSMSSDPVAEYPHTIVFDMGVSQKINKIYSTPYNGGATQDRAPKEGSIAFSDDGVNFGEETNLDFVTNYVKTYYTFPTVTKRYFRISITKNKFLFDNPGDVSNASKIVSISEIGANYVVVETPFFSDNFDGYSLGSFDGQFQAGEWSGWAGGDSNAIVSTDQAVSGSQSIKIWDDATTSTESDLVALLGTLSTGVKQITMKQYIPSTGSGAYYNLLRNYVPSTGDAAWAVDVYFGTSPAAATITANGVETPFTPTFDAWVEQKVILDFTNNQGKFYYGGALIHTWILNKNADGTAGDNTINAMNFYAANIGDGASSLAYYDNIAVAEFVEGSLGIDDFSSVAAKIYPNPSTTEFSLSITSVTDQAFNVRVFDISGRLVSAFKTTPGTVMFGSGLKAGIYIAEIVQGNNRKTIKLIKL